MPAIPEVTETSTPAAPPVPEGPPMPPKMTILTLGLSLSGKTTFLKTLQGDPNPAPKPTVGFIPHALQLGSSIVTFYDLGGGDTIRDIWENYYAETHGIIYILDAASDDMTFKTACDVFLTSINSPPLKGQPCLLILNKKDLSAYRDLEEVKDEIGTKSRGAKRRAMNTTY